MEKLKKDWGTWYFNLGFVFLMIMGPNGQVRNVPEIGHFQNDTNDIAQLVATVSWLLLVIGGVLFYHTIKDEFDAIKNQKTRRVVCGVITVVLFQIVIPVGSIWSAILYAKIFL